MMMSSRSRRSARRPMSRPAGSAPWLSLCLLAWTGCGAPADAESEGQLDEVLLPGPSEPQAPKSPPAISLFQATAAALEAGQSTELSWVVSGATEVRLEPGVGAVTRHEHREPVRGPQHERRGAHLHEQLEIGGLLGRDGEDRAGEDGAVDRLRRHPHRPVGKVPAAGGGGGGGGHGGEPSQAAPRHPDAAQATPGRVRRVGGRGPPRR